MGARNESRATGAIARLEAEGALSGGNAGKVIWLPLDLATPESAKRGAEEFLRRETRLDILSEFTRIVFCWDDVVAVTVFRAYD